MTLEELQTERTCENCIYGKEYENGADITTMDEVCGGCCSWNDKFEPKGAI